MENASDLFDPKRLGPLWKRAAEEDSPDGDARAGSEPVREEAEPARVALENMEASVRRNLGGRVKPLEPLLAKAREFVLAHVAKERVEREAAEEKARAEALAAAGVEVPSEEPAPEAPPPEAPAEPGPRKALKRHAGPETEQEEDLHHATNTETLNELDIAEVDVATENLHAVEELADRDANDAPLTDMKTRANQGKVTGEDLGQLDIAPLDEGLAAADHTQTALETAGGLADRIAPEPELSEADLLKNVANLSQLLNLIEDLYRAQLLVK
jgi:hypothetical protein